MSRQFMSHKCIDRWRLTVHGVHARVGLSWIGRLEHALVLIRHWSAIQSLFVNQVLITQSLIHVFETVVDLILGKHKFFWLMHGWHHWIETHIV